MPQTSQSVIPAIVALRDGPFTLEVAPEIGGAIVGLHIAWPTPALPDGIEPLRRTPDAALAARDVRQAGSFAMIPYSNRMRECTLHFQHMVAYWLRICRYDLLLEDLQVGNLKLDLSMKYQ